MSAADIQRSVVETRLATVRRDRLAITKAIIELQTLLKQHVAELERMTGREAALTELLALPDAPAKEGERDH